MAETTFRVQQIDHVELYVPDQDEAAEWYREVFGLEALAEYRFWAEEGGPLMISSNNGGTMLALFKGQPPGFQEPRGFRRVAFRVDASGFLQFLDHVQTTPVFNHDGQPTRHLDVIDHDASYSVYFCDPYGNRYEVTTYDYDEVSSRLATGADDALFS